jgi:hypothetical protein
MPHDKLIEKYPHLREELETALQLQETSGSLQAKALYKEKQSTINSLIPELINLAKVWDENQLRYTITKMEILRDEIMSIERNSKAYDVLVDQIGHGDFDKSTDDE